MSDMEVNGLRRLGINSKAIEHGRDLHQLKPPYVGVHG